MDQPDQSHVNLEKGLHENKKWYSLQLQLKKSSSTVKTFVNVEVSIFYKSIKWTPFSAV